MCRHVRWLPLSASSVLIAGKGRASGRLWSSELFAETGMAMAAAYYVRLYLAGVIAFPACPAISAKSCLDVRDTLCPVRSITRTLQLKRWYSSLQASHPKLRCFPLACSSAFVRPRSIGYTVPLVVYTEWDGHKSFTLPEYFMPRKAY